MVSVREFVNSDLCYTLRDTLKRNIEANKKIICRADGKISCLLSLVTVEQDQKFFVSHFVISGTVENPEFLGIFKLVPKRKYFGFSKITFRNYSPLEVENILRILRMKYLRS